MFKSNNQTGLSVSCFVFRHARVSSTYPSKMSVRPSVRPSHFRISNLSASLVALREKLKREDPNYFCVFSESVFSESVFSKSVFSESVFFESVFSESVFLERVFLESVFSGSVFFESVFFESVFSTSLVFHMNEIISSGLPMKSILKYVSRLALLTTWPLWQRFFWNSTMKHLEVTLNSRNPGEAACFLTHYVESFVHLDVLYMM